jgi:hypothetical protein
MPDKMPDANIALQGWAIGATHVQSIKNFYPKGTIQPREPHRDMNKVRLRRLQKKLDLPPKPLTPQDAQTGSAQKKIINLIPPQYNNAVSEFNTRKKTLAWSRSKITMDDTQKVYTKMA